MAFILLDDDVKTWRTDHGGIALKMHDGSTTFVNGEPGRRVEAWLKENALVPTIAREPDL